MTDSGTGPTFVNKETEVTAVNQPRPIRHVSHRSQLLPGDGRRLDVLEDGTVRVARDEPAPLGAGDSPSMIWPPASSTAAITGWSWRTRMVATRSLVAGVFPPSGRTGPIWASSTSRKLKRLLVVPAWRVCLHPRKK